MKIIYATTNEQKKSQIEHFFKAVNIKNIEMVTLKDIGFTEEIEETGSTFEENSMIKAKKVEEYARKNDIKGIIVADDTGLCVDALNGEPGIYSGRYAGENGHNGTQEANIKKVLENLDKTKDKDRKAKFVCVLTAILEDGKIEQVRGECKGSIAKKIGPMGKLTYGPIFIPEGFNKVINEMEDKELGITHREKAFMELLKILKEIDK